MLRNDGSVWTTDQDGFILVLLVSAILAVTGSTPAQRQAEFARSTAPRPMRAVDIPANREQKARLAKLSAKQVIATKLAGKPTSRN